MSDVPSNINRDHLLKAIKRIDNEGVEKGAHSSTYDVLFEGKRYPSKLVVSWANEFANGQILDRDMFKCGLKSACFKVITKAGLEIVEKESNIIKIAEQFIEDAKSGSQKTKHYPKTYKGLKVKVSFGQGGLAKVPWVAFLKEGEEVQRGIYPVLHIYKDFNCLVLSYGISRNNPPLSSWDISDKQTISDYLKETYGAPDNTYSESFICGAYEIDKPLDSEKLDNDIERILKDYENAKFAFNKIGIAEPSSQYTNEREEITMPYLNQILYGPPGTGKTYSTINKALEVIEPEFLATNKSERNILKERFDSLVKANRIGFVTFHQSFSYEDFVEGIKASSGNGKHVSYDVEDGIFKRMCDDASFKGSLSKFNSILSDFKSELQNATNFLSLKTIKGKSFKVDYDGGDTFKIYQNAAQSDKPSYTPVKGLEQLYRTGKKDGIYNPSYITPIFNYFKQNYKFPDFEKDESDKDYVLIIDEINRGNIANIFGELITLIEPSKRVGGGETITVKLPYSKKPFSVPSNLYLVGTMNTADKSLAQVDIALRRRFQFIEMMTNYDELEKIQEVNGINIRQLVETINKRIELLYDREHTIGHSFFLPLKDEPTIERLSSVFELQILPLLEEYFFEDWERVGQVLGDHLKPNNDLRFIIEKFTSSDMSKLMGDEWELAGIQPYVRNDSALNNPQAYIGIYELIS
jgi:5-methylcytosine-specific restriction protein B